MWVLRSDPVLRMPDAGHAENRPRIASINTCTDQSCWRLPTPSRSSALVRIPATRTFLGRGGGGPLSAPVGRSRGRADPEAGRGGGRPFHQARNPGAVEGEGPSRREFDAARSLDDAKQQMRQMGELLGHPDRAAAENARLDAAIARTRAAASRVSYRVLALSRRGWVSGDDSLMGSLLTATGLTSAAAKVRPRVGGFARWSDRRRPAGPAAGVRATANSPKTRAARSCCIPRSKRFIRRTSASSCPSS